MAWWTLISWVLIAVILVPLTTGALGSMVFRGDRLTLVNEEILNWLMTPAGLGYILIFAGLTVIGTVFRYAGLFHILTDHLKGQSVPVRQTLLKLLPDLPALFQLCLKTAGAALIFLLPILAGLGVIYWIWLTEFDINYYLYVQPQEWWNAIIAAGLWLLLMTVTLLYLVIRSLPALPAYLDGYRPVRKALAKSWAYTKGRAVRFLWLLLLCLAAWFLVRFVAHTLLFTFAGLSVDLTAAYITSLTPVLLLTGLYALLSFLLDVVISFLGFSLTAIVLTKFYYEQTDLHSVAPPVPLGISKLPAKAASLARNWLYPKRAVPVLAILLLPGIGAGSWWLSQAPDETGFTVSAHRAGAFLATENTIAALERTIETGADYAEIDVRTTRDGEVVVFHDADLKRMTGDTRRLENVRYDEIKDLVQGTDDEISDEKRRIATLDEFLERSEDRIKLNIELKYYGPDPELARKTAERVQAHNMEDQTIIMSFDMDAIREVQQLAPEIPTGYLATVAMGDLTRMPVDFLAVPRPLASEPFIRNAHRRNKEVHVWTINTLPGMLDVALRGADSIITDAPDVAMEFRNELSELTAGERLLLRFRPTLEMIGEGIEN